MKSAEKVSQDKMADVYRPIFISRVSPPLLTVLACREKIFKSQILITFKVDQTPLFSISDLRDCKVLQNVIFKLSRNQFAVKLSTTNPRLLLVDSCCITCRISLHALVQFSGWPKMEITCSTPSHSHSHCNTYTSIPNSVVSLKHC